MDISGTTKENIRESFNKRVYISCKEFIAKYDLNIEWKKK